MTEVIETGVRGAEGRTRGDDLGVSKKGGIGASVRQRLSTVGGDTLSEGER